MKEIPLTHGRVALVDDEDLLKVSAFSWHAVWSEEAQTYYAHTNVRTPSGKNSVLSMHRLIMGSPKDSWVDHIGCPIIVEARGLDNRRCNLRFASPRQNAQNRKKPRGTRSRFKGAYWNQNNKKWQASLRVFGRNKSQGYFVTEEEAARAYDAAAKKYFGEFALTNEQLGLFGNRKEG